MLESTNKNMASSDAENPQVLFPKLHANAALDTTGQHVATCPVRLVLLCRQVATQELSTAVQWGPLEPPS